MVKLSDLALLKEFPKGWFTKTVKEKGGETEIDCRLPLEAGDLSELLRQELKEDLRFNLLTLEPELKGISLTSAFIENFYVFLSEHGYNIRKGAAMDALLYTAQKNAFHPVVEYLERIEKDNSIQPIDLKDIANDYLGVDDELSNQMLATCLIGAVGRALHRGICFKHCLILKSNQHMRKSAFWEELASTDWFTDTNQCKDQDFLMSVQTTWIYELAEIEYMTSKHEQGKLKNWLSSRSDKFRVPYGRATEIHKRPSVFVGSCNRSDFLNDPTGNVRFWVIELTEKIDAQKVRIDRDKIWKAAIVAYRENENYFIKNGIGLSDELQEDSDFRNEQFEAEHPFFARLAEWTDRTVNQYPFTTEQALIGSGCRSEERINNNDAKEAGNCLRKLGYKKDEHQKREEGGLRVRRWRLPDWPKTIEPLKIELPNRLHGL